MDQLGRDLYDINRELLDSLKEDEQDQEEHEEEQREQLLQKVRRRWRRRRRTRERDTRVLRGQLLGLKAIKAARVAGENDAGGAGDDDEMDDDGVDDESMPPESVAGDSQAGDARPDVSADARRILGNERNGRRWWVEFSEPRARMHTQGNLLIGEKSSGGSRNKKQKLFLGWLRGLHTSKEAEFRRGNDTYANAWNRGDWGSPYSTFWPRGALATTLSVNLEHIVCSEWLRNGEIVRESGYSRQDVTVTTIVNQSENSSRNDRPLSVFGTPNDRNNNRLYTPPDSSRLKRTRLALASCHGMLSYPLVQQESKASGSKRFAGNFGVPEYARRLAKLRQYALADSSGIARRLAFITSDYHVWHNPLVLRPGLLRVRRYADLMEMRLRGGRSADGATLSCGLALLVDNVLSASLSDAPV